jgi:hypothetical protein
MYMLGADFVLRAKDRLLAVVTLQGEKRLDQHIDTLSQSQVITKKKRGK